MEATKKPTPMAIITKSSILTYLNRCPADPGICAPRFVMNAEPNGIDAR
jgi:hypothetical protein